LLKQHRIAPAVVSLLGEIVDVCRTRTPVMRISPLQVFVAASSQPIPSLFIRPNAANAAGLRRARQMFALFRCFFPLIARRAGFLMESTNDAHCSDFPAA
jgi:hypothetical protein